MGASAWFYVGFTAFVLAMLAIDLGIFHRVVHVVRPKEAGVWVAVWMTLALAFSAALLFWKGAESALLFITGYLVEQSLSIDNIFVIVLIFSAFQIPGQYQHRVLFWGIIGALVMRGLFIGMGTLLMKHFDWIMYVFGGLLIFTGIKMALRRDERFDAEQNPVIRITRRFLPVVNKHHGPEFFVVRDGRRFATPLLLVLVLIEFTDLVFALDSIPAVFAVTTDPFLVYTSNVFAILGLRSMYFLLAHIVHRFAYLKYGLALILTFVGTKMVTVDIFRFPILASLGVIVVALILSIAVSLLFPPKRKGIIGKNRSHQVIDP